MKEFNRILMTRSLSLVRNRVESGLARTDKKFLRFLYSQIREIFEGGLSVLIRKACMALLMLVFIPFILAVRALRPLILIRFGPLVTCRIGHFAGNTELYLCERDAGIQNPRAFDIFYHWPPVCNQQLKKMWERTLHISRIARPMNIFNRLLPGGKAHTIPMPSDRDIHGLTVRTPAHLSFTTEEERLGREGLREIGIPDSTPFVCFHARDSAYLNTVFPKTNWHYHEDEEANIHNYVPAAEEITRRGYFAIRMGAIVKEVLATTNPLIIDYATKVRNDFLDIFLSAKCYFFLCSPSGLYAVPMVFRRPLAYANAIPLEWAPTWSPNDLFIPKKLWLREERRFLTFGEILDGGIGRFGRTEQYEQLGIELIENTPEEITALVVEMDERLKGRWQTTEEDAELQNRFWALFKPTEYNRVFPSRIGAEFLRQNRDLLG